MSCLLINLDNYVCNVKLITVSAFYILKQQFKFYYITLLLAYLLYLYTSYSYVCWVAGQLLYVYLQ